MSVLRSITRPVLYPVFSPINSFPGGLPQPPKNLTATVSGSDIVLTWDAAISVDGYNIYQSIDGGTWTKLNATTETGLTYALTPVDPGEYNFYVTSVRGTKESSPSAETTTTEAMMVQVYTDTVALNVSAVDGTAFIDSEDESVYESDFSAGLDGWSIDSLDDVSTWTHNVDEGVLAVTTVGTNAIRPFLIRNNVFSSSQEGKYVTFTVAYTLNSGVCYFTAHNLGNFVPLSTPTQLSGSGTIEITKKVAGGNTFFALYFDGTNLSNLSIHSITVTKHPAMAISADYTDGNHLLEVQDSGTTIASGVLKTQGVTETFGATVSTGTLTAKTLYKIVATELSHFGTGLVVDDYFTSDGTETCDANNTVKAVLTPSTSGATLVDEINGTTQNLFTAPATFEYNEASYTVRVKKILPTA